MTHIALISVKYDTLWWIYTTQKPPPRELGRGTNYEKLQT